MLSKRIMLTLSFAVTVAMSSTSAEARWVLDPACQEVCYQSYNTCMWYGGRDPEMCGIDYGYCMDGCWSWTESASSPSEPSFLKTSHRAFLLSKAVQ